MFKMTIEYINVDERKYYCCEFFSTFSFISWGILMVDNLVEFQSLRNVKTKHHLS
eukprot:UN11872